ncbi:MAG: right-handed parallel beta-helix repeat-containing protein [Planctomycetes bacterium]|nr:right-handed parallel beta-helix repeat-containing protein [Planctomycetota bacterium]
MISRSSTPRCSFIAAFPLALALALAPTALATQHLIAHGESWEHLSGTLKPGDEVILMPGRHQPVTLDAAHGSSERPIVIRGLDPKRPPVIVADRYGIRMRDPRHVRIENVIVSGATIHGISLEGSATDPDANDLGSGPVNLTNVLIDDTGPKGLRHAINARLITKLRVETCRITGWAGSGLEIVGCEDVEVRGCRFVGKEEFEQVSGIRVRGGSDRVKIDRCRFTATGKEAVCIGGRSKLEEFRIPITDDTEPGSLHEASRVWVTRCITEGGACAFSFVQCERSSVRQCTILGPKQAVVSLRHEQSDPRFGSATGCSFGSNLITWTADEMASLTHLGTGADRTALTLADNLWWTTGMETTLPHLGSFPGVEQFPQVTEVDPKLDEALRPTVAAAEMFGAFAP